MSGDGRNEDAMDSPFITERRIRSGQILLDRFKVIEQIGGGGIAEVWLAQDQELEVPRALKVLRQDVRFHPREAEELKQEARIAARLDHPNIARLHDIGFSSEGYPVLVLDYVPGWEREGKLLRSLYDWLWHFKKLSEEEVRRILPPILDALEFAHSFQDERIQKGIVHCDIKPANILLDSEGQPKVIDFHIAEIIRSTTASLSGERMPRGTSRYMSPEQICGKEKLDPRSDIYSLGILIYELLTGEPPFKNGIIEYQHLNVAAAELESISDDFSSLVRKAMAKDPEDRWISCNEMKHALVGNTDSDTQSEKYTTIQEAAEEGDLQSVKRFVEGGVDIDAKNQDGTTPLQASAWWGHKEIAAFLLEKEANVHVRDNYDWTPLSGAAQQDHYEIVELLLGKGADPNGKDKHGTTAVNLAAGYGRANIVRALLLRGANPNIEDDSGVTPLMNALRRADRETIELLVANGADTNESDRFGWTPLMCASGSGQKEIVRLLLKNGADLNAEARGHRTALDSAARFGDRELVELLLAKGARTGSCYGKTDELIRSVIGAPAPKHSTIHEAVKQVDLEDVKKHLECGLNPDVPDCHLKTPLIRAAQKGYQDIAEFLLAKGADVNATCESGISALHYAAWEAREDVVELLLNNDASMDVRNDSNETPLNYALQSKNEKVVKLLLDKGADPNVNYEDGSTLLEMATLFGQEKIVRLLLNGGADVNQPCSNGDTALFKAVGYNQEDIVAMLLLKGADPNKRNENGHFALHEAAHHSSEKIARMLLANGADVNATDVEGHTPLHYGHVGDSFEELFREYGGVDR